LQLNLDNEFILKPILFSIVAYTYQQAYSKFKSMKQLIICLAGTLFLSSCVTHYYVVRHADRLNNTANSPLSEAGFARARALRDTLSTKSIDSIFASTFLRTQQTAEPTATALGKTVIIYSTDTTTGLINRLKKIVGKNVLVVGHSNTVPVIVQGLSDQAVAPIAEDDFDNLYIIKVRKWMGIKKWLTQTTYGKPSP
jgi:phosphohistidine phosphatase SixA